MGARGGVGVVHFALGPRNDATLIVRRRAVLLDRAVYSPVDRSREVGGAGSMARYRLTQSDEPALNGLDCATLLLASHWACRAGATGRRDLVASGSVAPPSTA
jgi:hypothetical protein